jgi:phosphoadenosine phosphosulfate reductase
MIAASPSAEPASTRVRVEGLDLATENARLELLSPLERLAFAVDHFGDALLFTSSFGAGSGVLLHMWSEVSPARPVVFIDTGFLFAETLAYRDALVKQLGLKLEIVRPEVERAAFLAEWGEDISKRNPDFCCAHNKVEPLRPKLATARAWVSGLRRDQGATRAATPVLLPSEGEPLKVHPLVTMTAAKVADYMHTHGIPEHPLKARRYLSIGCVPCTRAVGEGEDERGGRWAWSAKTECGLHARALGASPASETPTKPSEP